MHKDKELTYVGRPQDYELIYLGWGIRLAMTLSKGRSRWALGGETWTWDRGLSAEC